MKQRVLGNPLQQTVLHVVQAQDGKCMYHLMVVWEIQLQNSLR